MFLSGYEMRELPERDIYLFYLVVKRIAIGILHPKFHKHLLIEVCQI